MNVKALLRQVPMTAYLYGVLAVAVVGGIAEYNHLQREIGKREVMLSQAEHERVAARMRADSLEKVYRVDTLRLTRLKTVWDTTYQRLTDTLKLTDTVKVPVKVLVLADSSIKACTMALQTCDQRVGAERQRREAAEKEIGLLKASYPSKAKPWLYGALGVGVGYLAGRLQK